LGDGRCNLLTFIIAIEPYNCTVQIRWIVAARVVDDVKRTMAIIVEPGCSNRPCVQSREATIFLQIKRPIRTTRDERAKTINLFLGRKRRPAMKFVPINRDLSLRFLTFSMSFRENAGPFGLPDSPIQPAALAVARKMVPIW
jgi:hypothetical protein